MKKAERPFAKLRLKMAEKNINQQLLSEVCNICRQSLSYKLAGLRPFTTDEIYLICNVLDIPEEEILKYFPRRDTQCQKDEAIKEFKSVLSQLEKYKEI